MTQSAPVSSRARFQAVVFDLDGTLVDTMSLVFRAYQYALAPYRPVPTREEIMAVLGGPIQVGLERLLPPGAPLEEALQRMWAYGEAHREEVELLNGAVDLLGRLRESGVRVGLWTGRDRASTRLILDAFQLWDYLQAVVCGDDLPTHKPDPQGLFVVLDQMRVEPARAAFVGDSIHDVRAGLKAGVYTVAVGPEGPYLPERADLVVPDLVTLQPYLFEGH